MRKEMKWTSEICLMAVLMVMLMLVIIPHKVEAAGYDSDYLIPYSDSEYLSLYNLQGMTLQAVNYAKNELYARHGRKFDSRELQDYFNTKSWYRGTVAAADFSDKVFNDYEQQNVEFLNDIEFLAAPKGYQLDQPGYDIYDLWDRTVIYSGYEYDNYDSEPQYYQSVYVIPDSDSRYLSESEVNAMTLQQLCYARNEIYARHGYMFQSHELQDYFRGQSWYYGYLDPVDFDMSMLNAYETANSSLLYAREYSLSATGYALY